MEFLKTGGLETESLWIWGFIYRHKEKILKITASQSNIYGSSPSCSCFYLSTTPQPKPGLTSCTNYFNNFNVQLSCVIRRVFFKCLFCYRIIFIQFVWPSCNAEVVTTALSPQLKVHSYLHDGLLIRKEVAKQWDVGLTKGGLVGDEAAFRASFRQHHCLGELAHLLQVFHTHLHEALALQVDVGVD